MVPRLNYTDYNTLTPLNIHIMLGKVDGENGKPIFLFQMEDLEGLIAYWVDVNLSH